MWVVGGGKVYLIETKNWAGKISYANAAILVNQKENQDPFSGSG